jgi:cytochrome oxidase assembly protein ShyY1
MIHPLKKESPLRFFVAFLSPVRNLGLTFLAFAVLLGCLIAGNWQFERGMERRAGNAEIEKNFEFEPSAFDGASTWQEEDRIWRLFTITGRFVPEEEILMRNRYHEERYGFGVATLFRLIDGRYVWIDRGWVKAGASATTPPEVVQVPRTTVELIVRYRSDSLDAKIRGSFFATGGSTSQLQKWNEEAAVASESFYFDLVGGDLIPEVPTTVPSISDGPHIAYAIQWWFFGALALFGRFLIAREERRIQAVGITQSSA